MWVQFVDMLTGPPCVVRVVLSARAAERFCLSISRRLICRLWVKWLWIEACAEANFWRGALIQSWYKYEYPSIPQFGALQHIYMATCRLASVLSLR